MQRGQLSNLTYDDIVVDFKPKKNQESVNFFNQKSKKNNYISHENVQKRLDIEELHRVFNFWLKTPTSIKKIQEYFATTHIDEIQLKFLDLARNWNEETALLSSPDKKCLNINYLKIIALGNQVVPYILRELQKKPDHWFLALKVLTNENPVNNSIKYNFKLCVKAWIDWGKSKNLL